MALSDKNILITPNIGQSADPKIVFSGADASLGAQNITLNVYPTSSGTLSFEGSAGQLFSVSNSLSGTIYSVNDVSGIPSIEVLDTGLIKFGQYGGNILIGTGTDDGVNKLQIKGNVAVNADGYLTFGPNSTWGSSLRIGGNGRTATGTEMASVVTTDGNLHLDAAASTNSTYINYYAGTGGVIFGNGASGIVAVMGPDGDLWKGSADNSGTQYVQNTGTWSISITGNAASVSNLSLSTTSNLTDTVANNAIGYVSGISLFGQTDGALYSQFYSGSWQHQIYGDYRTGQIAIRGKNNGTWQSWRAVVDASNVTSYAVAITNNTSLNTDSRNTRGVTRLYRRDDNSDYSVQTYWTGTYWRLYGYTSDTAHADTQVGYADSAGTAASCSGNAATATNVAGIVQNSFTTYGNIASTTAKNGYYGYLMGNSTSNLQIMADGSGNGGFYREASGWPLYYLAANGSVGIMSSTTSASYALYVTGAIYATTSIVAYSDERAKKNIVRITDALEKVRNIQGVYYDKIDESEIADVRNRGKRQVGFLAQKLEKVLPEAVTYDYDNDKYGVQYGNVTALLVEAIKEQQTQIEAQEERIRRLEELITRKL